MRRKYIVQCFSRIVTNNCGCAFSSLFNKNNLISNSCELQFAWSRPLIRYSSNIFSTVARKLKIMKPQVVFVLGGPGAGKGTQCQKIVKKFEFDHLSAGDLLREERSRPNSEYGELIEKHIREGTIVPVEITCSLIERAMTNSKNYKFLIDGFPRNKNNLDGWTKQMSDKVILLFVLFFDCSSGVCEKRCLDRGAAGSGRSDDNIESLRKRFNTYRNDTMPIVEHYHTQNLVRTIDASKLPDEVFEDVKTAFFEMAKGDL